ncbi:MAG: ATP-binding protein [Gaiellaceae bacterium]
MPPRPSGTVTFLFSDVEGSTSLLDQLGPSAYAAELELHRAALRRAWESNEGVEIDTQGDAFFVAFSRAGDAVKAAREAQAVLREHGVRVRMGIHTGEPLLTKDGYVGMDVHRAARIAAAGHGGQVLLSHTTRDLLAGDQDVVDLGEHRLKDLTRPERVFQLGHASFPALRSLNRSNLPEAAHPLVGRAVEQLEVEELLRRVRLVTITGPGGTGKTRLALQIAAELSDEFPDGVHFVPLAALADPGLVLSVALQALGLSEDDDVDRHALLVLDNFEHLRDAAPAIARFLQRSPGPTLLVTSRTPLHVSMETEYPLDPLPQAAAVELFLDRAHAVRRSAEPSPEVDEICRRLDCLPLALELAAARLKLLDPAALLHRLDSRLSLLTRGPTDLPERQQTLEATIAWSYDLLDPEAQCVFLRLSVFAGTFDIDAAEAVADADLEALTTLTEASLLKARGDSRFLILETIREFARQRLPLEEALRLPSRHAHYYLSVAEKAAPHLTGHDAGTWLATLDADHGNFRTALDWLALEAPEHVPRLTICLWRYWLVRGRFEEGQRAIERALGLGPAPTEHAELLYQLGAIVISRGATARGRAVFQEALERFRGQGLQDGEARSLSALGHVAADAGEWREAIGRYEAAAALFRVTGDQFGLGGILGDLANVYLRSGSPAEALPLAAESLTIQRTIGNRQGEALALAIQGYGRLGLGKLRPARRALAESTSIAHRLGYLHGLVFSLNGLAAIACRSGDEERAQTLFEAAHALRASIGIDHDPDDVLVAEDRARLARGGRVPRDEELDLERVVALALAD